MAEPVNRTILLLDIEESGRRLNVEQAVMRRMMYAVLRDTLAAASIEPSEYRTEDRGDGVFVLVDSSVPKPQLLRALLTRLPTQLFDSNRLASASVQVRLRLVLHSGEVALDEEGAIGADVVEAFRLLDSPELRSALRSTTEPSVLCVSDTVYRGVVHHQHPGIRREHFHRFVTGTKEGSLVGWVHDARRETAPVEEAVTPASAERQAPEQAPEPPQGSALPPMRIGSGNFFFGAGAQVMGDAVAGDKYVGRGTPEGGAR